MDAGSHAQPPLENPMDFTPPRQTGDDDAAEGLWFGRLTSPEKRPEDTTPRRRSARLAQTSTPVRPSNLRIIVPQVEEAVEETDPANDTTEINQDVEDEPSQVLAERVLSAVSNPSPPPDYRSFPEIHVNTPPPPEPPESQTQSDDTSAAATPPNPTTGPSLSGEGMENTFADSVDRSTPRTLSSSTRPPGSVLGSTLTIEQPLVAEPSVNNTVDLPPPALAATSSVNPSMRLQADQGERAVTASEKGKGRDIIDDETRDQVAELPTLGESHTKPAGRRCSARRSASPAKRRSTSPDMNFLQPPRRRSARLSVSPHRTPSPDPTFALPQISPLRLPTRDARTRPRPSEVGALSTIDGIDERLMEAEREETQERAGRKRKRQDDAKKAVGRQRLGSLSPDSQSVLQQLLPSSRSSSDEGENQNTTTSHQSLFGPQRILVKNPPKLVQSTHIQTTDPQPHLGTPLRRVLVSTSAVPEDGGPSGRRLGQIQFKVQSLDDPNRSPSRRVPVVTGLASAAKSVVPQPIGFLRQPPTSDSSSTLPSSSKLTVRQRSMSEEPTFSHHPSSETNHRTALPYPLTQKPSVIPEEPEETQPPTPHNSRALSEPPVPPLISTPRSTLKQPTNPSRIPRIGAKPYSRPPGVQASKLPILAPIKHAVPSPTKSRNQTGSTRGSLPSDSKQGPFVPTSSRKTTGPSTEASSKPPVKRPLPTKRPPQRPAVAEKPPPSQIPIRSPPPPQPLALPGLQPPTVAVTESASLEQGQADIPSQLSVPPENQLIPENVSISARLRPRDASKKEEDISAVRRTTRGRGGPSALLEETIFGATSVSPSRPPPKKRPPPDSSGFAGLTITALKNLTTDNTTKNQKVVSLLETEIVKKEGKRPESPAVKLRTIAEKANEEKAKQREERAQRRAKRSDSGEVESVDVNGLSLGGGDRHRRGAGEEEDYESPERPTRPLKRLKADGSEEVEIEIKERRVQWDRLLFTATFIDDIPEKPLQPPERKLGKGCLSQAAKSLELDRLGNVQDAGLPLPQLPTEKVVVKRYIYDDDPPPELEVPEEPEAPPVKITRSKGQKK